MKLKKRATRRIAKPRGKSWVKPSTIAIAGVGAAAIAGAYWFFSKQDFSVPQPQSEAFPVQAMPPTPPGLAPTGPDLSGPRVKRGVEVSTRTQITTATKYPGMKYYRITKTDKQGYRFFTPGMDGVFTRRLLSAKGHLWAEVKPA